MTFQSADTRTFNLHTDAGKVHAIERIGSKSSIVFLHGNSFSSRVFANQFQSEALRNHRLIALDLLGHGQSDNAKNPNYDYTISGFADTIAECLDQLNVPNCILVGWSLGGHVALDLLGRHAAISGLFLSGATAVPSGPMGVMRGFHFSRDMLLASKAVMTEPDSRRWEAACLGAYADGSYIADIMRTDPQLRPVLSKSTLRGRGNDHRAAVLQSKVPIHFLNGANEPFIRLDYLNELTGKDNVTSSRMSNAGHGSFLQQAEAFNSEIINFAETVSNHKLPSWKDVRQRLALAS